MNISMLKPKRIQGQGMTEYIIIVALIAVAAIGVSMEIQLVLKLQLLPLS